MENHTQWLSDSILGARNSNSIALERKAAGKTLSVLQKLSCFAAPDSRRPEGVLILHL